MSLQGRWSIEQGALARRWRSINRLLGGAGLVLACAGLEAGMPSEAGLALAGFVIALAAIAGWVAAAGGARGAVDIGTKAVSAVASLEVDARGQATICADPPAPGPRVAAAVRPLRWHRGAGHLWIVLGLPDGTRRSLSGSPAGRDDASAARLGAWLVWVRRSRHR
jgi:hypothetical protein